MKLYMELGKESYDITVENYALLRLSELFDLNRKVLVVTDENIPLQYVEAACSACREPVLSVLPAGEETKRLSVWEELCTKMLQEGFTRTDAVLAIGGGVVGDLAGFVAACYMRGIDFYNVPTTLLSQVDSSIGGKTAVDLCSTKNIIGAFHQPRAVAVDPTLLYSLPPRQLSNGMAEAIKMSATCDEGLFRRMEEGSLKENLPHIITRSLQIKKDIVEQDEKEKGLRRVLNFGHTVGHGIETVAGGQLYHGECVALGMLFLCSDKVRSRLEPVLKKAGLPTEYKVDMEQVLSEIRHDKKADGDAIHYVYVSQIGSFELRKTSFPEFEQLIKERAKP